MLGTLEVKDLKSQIFTIFNHLHNNPEVSWKEYETTRYITGLLEELGVKFETFEDCTGVVAEMGEGPFTVGLRADMDALWQEVDGAWKANHSCGHDAHMTLALGVILSLKKMNVKLPGKVKFIFQPAEEKANGALKMLEKKVIDDIDYLYGVHVRPDQEVPHGKAAPAIVHGAGKFITGKIIGDDLHGGRPHLGANAIEVGSAIVQEIKGIRLDPQIPYSVKMTRFTAGGDNDNIIPGSAEFAIDMRAQTNQAMRQLAAKVEKIIETISALYQVRIDFTYAGNAVAAEVNEEAQSIMAEAIQIVLGKDHLFPPSVTSGCEDFHFYNVQRPEVKATMLGLGCGLAPGLHHPKMTFDRDALITGTEILTRAILTTFEKNGLKVEY
ncbi:M20 peptidase aminoacylase family protein [Bacillus sp. T33-2]|uniref:M20 peptidase aminoacylase family protein n=1 Tax=Bacillus sp. T33-2 TaxID=2054168 RepID=UPI000C7818A6|nr:M20 peptidase aminoacylase family protein [Bacillus sp. T33-2]PLR95976.1 amidohydrolase [Bacillus sp. T33-2]